MKRHKSVLQLFIRSSFLQVLAVCTLVAVSNSIMFFRTWERLTEQYLAGELQILLLENVIDEARFLGFFVIGMGLITVFLRRVGSNAGGRLEYTLYRLQITPKQVFLWQAFYNGCCYVLFWMVQSVVVFLLGMYFVRTADSSMVTNQSLFLAFYRNDFLHGVLPLEHVAGWLRNFSWFATLGWTVAYDVYVSRRGKHSIWMYAVLITGFFNFAQGMEGASIVWTVILLYIMVFAITGYVTLKEGKWTVDGE